MAFYNEKTYGSVSRDFLEKIADYTMQSDEGETIKFRKSDGSIDLDLLLYTIGFKWDYHRNVAEYSVLSKIQRFKNLEEDQTGGVLVRNQKRPHEVRDMTVYAGEIRPTFPYKSLWKDTTILTGDFVHGGEIKNILDIGSKNAYDQGAVGGGEHRTLYDNNSVARDDD